MALIDMQKTYSNKVDGVTSNDLINNSKVGDDNLGTLNLNATNYEYNPEKVKDDGMNRGRVKREEGIVSICISTLITAILVFGLTLLAALIAMKFTGVKIDIFPTLDYYSLETYNASVRRSFIILASLLIGVCILIMFSLNLTIRSRFINNFLSKYNIYIYDIFSVFLNCFVYLGIIFLFFYIDNQMIEKINTLYKNGSIVIGVNLNTMELFKYIIIIVTIIFMILNAFNVVSIIHKKNRFVFEEEV